MSAVVTVGETMAVLHGAGPLRLGGQLELSIAGAESNVAIALARLGHSVTWVGAVGNDELGELVLRTLRGENVDLREVVVDPHRPTGLMMKERRIGDLTRVRYYRVNSAGSAVDPASVHAAITNDTQWVHLTGITPALGEAALAAVHAAVHHRLRQNWTLSFDVNYRSRLWSRHDARTALQPIAKEADVIFASEDELSLISPSSHFDTEQIVASFLAGGTREVVVKRGAAGADAHTLADVYSVPAVTVAVRDLVGAGDAFVAGYISATLDHLAPTQRLRRGAILGAFAVSCGGDWEGLPTRSELSLLDVEIGTTQR